MHVQLHDGALALAVLTAWRATHLIVEDDFPPIRWARERVTRSGPEWLGDLVSCIWCAGVWVAAAAVLVADYLGSVPLPWLVFGGLAAAIPIIEALVARLEREPAPPPAPPSVGPEPTTIARRER